MEYLTLLQIIPTDSSIFILGLGFNCEECDAGYYGDPTSLTFTDCHTCPCYDPRVVNSTCNQLVNGSVQCYCQEGYAGGLCDRSGQHALLLPFLIVL